METLTYSIDYQKTMAQFGIEAEVMRGYSNEELQEGHAWNCISITAQTGRFEKFKQDYPYYREIWDYNKENKVNLKLIKGLQEEIEQAEANLEKIGVTYEQVEIMKNMTIKASMNGKKKNDKQNVPVRETNND